jgi:predicted porin
MNKKLMAVAVAGAFAAPAVALAQNATVQLYGKATFEYGYADQGGGRPNTDQLSSPGGTSVGVKGEEKLGGGLSAWFQCESSADVLIGGDGFCTRNSAIGLKGNWGNLHIGRWDTPFKKATVGMVGSGDTGLLGAAFLFAGNSTGSVATGGQGSQVDADRTIWKRREGNSIMYESPKFSGFQILGLFSAANATAVTDGTTNAKPRVWSLSGLYNNGPLQIGLGYEKHVDFGNGNVGDAAVAATPGNVTFVGAPVAGANAVTDVTVPDAGSAATAGTGGDDRGWTVGINYTFMGTLEVGAQYVDYKYDMGNGTDLKKKNWMIGADWNFSGPHHVMGSYINAGNSKGSATVSPGGNIKAPSFKGTGADLWEIAYQYDFSKRTNVKLGYVRVSNDDGAAYSLGGLKAPPAGDSQSAFVMYGEHRW